LLAVIEHRLGKKKAREAYDKAVTAYDRILKSGSKRDAALRLLCLADLGQFELQKQNFHQAALEFQRALEQRVLCPVPFQIYVLSNEANAWQQLGRWGEANTKLDQVIRLATPLEDPKAGSPLTAFAYTRRAWAYMEQWNFFAAVEAFNRADEHLPRDNDREATIIRFHNRHGLAMARRFTGDPEGALADYRRVSKDIREKFSKLRQDSGVERDFGEIRERLAERLINTLERQADCNLYRDNGDLKEASDDLRRAIRVTDYLPPSRRNPTRAVQLCKQALALGRRSPYQDLVLASAYLREAEELVKTLSQDQQAWVGYYRKLAGSVVQMGTAIHLADEEPGGKAVRHDNCVAAIAGLRQTLNDLRPKLNLPIHRDHLEVLFYAAQCLIAEDLVHAGRYHLLADAEVLLMLCRQAMRNQSDPQVTQLYLRHHFDTVIRAMIAAKPKHVQSMIEAVYEARLGRHYDKPEKPAPSLVLYHLDGQFHAFLDTPNGISRFYIFDNVTLESLREADAGRKASLPRQLRADLATLKLDSACFPEAQSGKDADIVDTSLHVRWVDPVRFLGSTPKAPMINSKPVESEFPPGTRTSMYRRSYISAFPFELPGYKLLDTIVVPPITNSIPKK
jgi:tetratricopeptide (TPR) repeat protein